MQTTPFLYQTPPRAIAELLEAEPTPWLLLAPDAGAWLEVSHASMPSIADVAQPFLRLAGLRIDPATRAHHQTIFGLGLKLVLRASGVERILVLPQGRRIASLRWSHSSRAFALTLVGGAGTELWVGEVEGGELRFLAADLCAAMGEGFEWMPDGTSLLVSIVPRGQGAVPALPAHERGPRVQEAQGERTPLRTHPDLLQTPHDAALFEHYATSELALVDARTAELRPLGVRGIFSSHDVAPGGKFVLVTRVVRPYSSSHTVHGFPHEIDVLALDGPLDGAPGEQLVRRVASVPLAENIPIEGVRSGPRAVHWSPHEPALLLWVEALDGGDPRAAARERDRWMCHPAPFDAAPREFLRLEQRAAALSWLPDASQVIARQYDRDRRWMRASLHERASGRELAVIDDRSLRDRYGDPGSMLTRLDARGRRILRVEDGAIFRAGEGQDAEAKRPFLVRQDLRTQARTELWRCEEGVYENVVALLEGAEHGALVTRHESPLEAPNLRVRELATGAVRALTHFPDRTPLVREITTRLVRYTRADGLALSGKLHLPPGWRPGTRLPLVIWAYPEDYPDEATAGQTRGTPHRFTRLHGPSQLAFALQGYAVLDDAALPIVGHPETMNDRFVEQAVASVRAAIEHLAAEGIVDPARVGVGGHSYGAFMTAMLLAHCDLFRAGIARSGAYNRTLTPFGFQSERRTLWEARASYLALSPFLDAEKIKAPLLLIHGAEDQNPGTQPIQSERLFQALKGTGGHARFVSLPHEGHGYRARESVLHVLWEMLTWFDRHVKGAS